MGLKIDKGIPFPEISRGRQKTKYIHDALDVMEVGDSIEFPLDSKRKSGQNFSKEGERFHAAARHRKVRLRSRSNSEANTVSGWGVE